MQKQALVRFEKYRFVKEGGQLIARGEGGPGQSFNKELQVVQLFHNAFDTCTNQPAVIYIIMIIVNIKIFHQFK